MLCRLYQGNKSSDKYFQAGFLKKTSLKNVCFEQALAAACRQSLFKTTHCRA
jgi:hypothetical protein